MCGVKYLFLFFSFSPIGWSAGVKGKMVEVVNTVGNDKYIFNTF